MATPKRIASQVTLQLEAGNAAMVDIGKMLGPTGINTRELKLDYDASTAQQRGAIVPIVVTVYDDRSYALTYRTPPTSFLIRRALGIDRGSPRPGGQAVGTLSTAQLRAIAETKLPDLNTDDIEKAMRQVAGTARSMGVQIAT